MGVGVMNYGKIRPEERPIRSKTYELMPNSSCTERIWLHPIKSETLILWANENSKGFEIDMRQSHASLVFIDPRQKWECYYYSVDEIGWNCERHNVVLRLSPDEFEKIFGEIKVDDTHRKDR